MNKGTILLVIVFSFAASISLKAQNWELKKERDGMKAYTTASGDNPVKSFKVVTTINSSMDCLYATITDYDHYVDMVKELSELEVLEKSDTSVITYSIIDMPWPFDDRDVVTAIKTVKNGNTITLTSSRIDYPNKPVRSHVVRMSEYSEQFLLESINENEIRLTLVGRADIGGAIPAWVQNMFIIDGPLDFVETIKKKCE